MGDRVMVEKFTIVDVLNTMALKVKNARQEFVIRNGKIRVIDDGLSLNRALTCEELDIWLIEGARALRQS